MRFSNPRFWVGFLSLMGVVALSLKSLSRTSPGPITSVHRIEGELSGKRDCAQCHGTITVSMTEACLECHEPVARQIETRDGLHGTFEGKKRDSCAVCHSEHHGEDFEIVNSRSYRLAGSEDPEGFDHALVGFPMDGQHLELECSECHENADVPILPRGETRFIGLDWSCATCHEDEHEGRMVMECAQCHGQEAFDQPASHGHERFLPLIGAHGALDCAACHDGDGPTALRSLGLRGQKQPARQCTDCHESPHDGRFAVAIATEREMAPKGSCVTCHAPEHESFRDEDLVLSAEDHALTGFALELPHEQVGCAECHDPALDAFEDRHPGRRARDCASCHEDPHGAQFASAPERRCIECHEAVRFEPHGFDVEHHAATALPLTGSHLDTKCNRCHEVAAEEDPRTFRGTPNRCEECHDDAHDGFFDERHGKSLAKTEGGSCRRCHNAESFSAVPEERFDHGLWTGFAVEGAHAQVECTVCHAPETAPDDWGRSFGRVADVYGSFDGCITCHADPHAGGFDAPGLPSKIGKREGCARCHVQSSFRSFPSGWDHGQWTGFPLDDAHAEAACSACHQPLDQPDEHGRTWSPAVGSNCQDCHADPHAGQFRRNDETACARCHKSNVKFEITMFDHDTQSRFELGDAHGKLECSECHEPWPLPSGGEVVRYRPLEFDCGTCHGAHHEQTRRDR